MQAARSACRHAQEALLETRRLRLASLLLTVIVIILNFSPEPGAAMIVGIHHIGVSVQNLDSAAAFYEKAFGFEEIVRFPLRDDPAGRAMLQLPAISGSLAMLRAPNMIVEAFEFSGAMRRPYDRPVNEPGITHFCLQTASMAEVATRMQAAGGEFASQPTDLGADILYAYPRDPDGNVIELECLPAAAETAPVWAAHVSITTPDIDRAVSFYERLTGATARRSGRLGPNAKIDQVTGLAGVRVSGAWIPVGNVQLEFWQYHEPAAVGVDEGRSISDPGYSHFAIEVDDLPADRARAEQLGMVFQGEPISAGGISATYGRDPDGIVVELIQLSGADRRLGIAALQDPNIVARVEQARALAGAA
jgi:catechol 2,3-dioxygenase-like lactoylglutathione lyase family enzyme